MLQKLRTFPRIIHDSTDGFDDAMKIRGNRDCYSLQIGLVDKHGLQRPQIGACKENI